MRYAGWVLAGIVAAGCGGAQQQITVVSSAASRPHWIGKLPQEPGMAYVVGMATRARTLEDGKQAAHGNAAVQISNIVGTQITSSATSVMDTEGTNYARDDVASRTAAFVKSLVVTDEYSEKTTKMVGSFYEESHDVWVLGRFPLNAADEERKRQAAEQAELGRDAYERYVEALARKRSRASREAWILMSQAAATLKGVPPLTEIHAAMGVDTAADLLRAVEGELRGLDEQARSVRVELAPEDAASKKAAGALAGELAKALRATGTIVRQKGEARFVFEVKLTASLSAKKVMGKQPAYLTFSGTGEDGWSGSSIAGASGEVKGFGKTADAALAEAAREAAALLAKSIAESVNGAVTQDLGAAAK